jgi:DNA-binding XRE family transcriptional regulator
MNELTNAMSPTFGDLLKQLRKRVGMTQDDLAAAIGYSRALIGPWNATIGCPTSRW